MTAVGAGSTSRKEDAIMISAKISNETRRAVYRRDGYRCALCDDVRGLQIHHVVRRSQGGTDYPQNLITLCWRCHAAAHGSIMPGYEDVQPADVAQACVEYLADLYAEEGLLWNPWEEQQQNLLGPP